jgi:hypothetical protein
MNPWVLIRHKSNCCHTISETVVFGVIGVLVFQVEVFPADDFGGGIVVKDSAWPDDLSIFVLVCLKSSQSDAERPGG